MLAAFAGNVTLIAWPVFGLIDWIVTTTPRARVNARVKLMDFKHPVTAGHFRRNESDQWFEVPRDTQDTTKLYHAPGWPHAGLPIKADPLTQAIQRLNANPYSLTKSECIDVLDKLRAELGR